MNNWHHIREWVVGLKRSYNFGKNTNNRTESINGILKQVIDKFSTFQKYFLHCKSILLTSKLL